MKDSIGRTLKLGDKVHYYPYSGCRQVRIVVGFGKSRVTVASTLNAGLTIAALKDHLISQCDSSISRVEDILREEEEGVRAPLSQQMQEIYYNYLRVWDKRLKKIKKAKTKAQILDCIIYKSYVTTQRLVKI